MKYSVKSVSLITLVICTLALTVYSEEYNWDKYSHAILVYPKGKYENLN